MFVAIMPSGWRFEGLYLPPLSFIRIYNKTTMGDLPIRMELNKLGQKPIYAFLILNLDPVLNPNTYPSS